MTSRRRILLGLLSSAIVLLTPVIVYFNAHYQYVRQYRGICGPYAPDIKAYPCSYETYMKGFSGGFGGVGLFIEIIFFTGLVAFFVALAWGVAPWFHRRRTPVQ